MGCAADLDALREAVRSGAGEDPLARVGRAVALAAELSEVADRLVDEFVAGARVAGCSWAHIGARLGVSKQGAQQRFAASTRAPAWVGKLGRRAGDLLARADGAAAGLGHDYVGTEHLLLGLLAEREQIAAHALLAAGVEEQGVRARAVAQLGERPPRAWAALGVRPELKRALALAREWAEHFGHRQIGSEHLLLGLLGVPDAGAVRILESLGAPPARVRGRLAELLGIDARELERPAGARRRLARRGRGQPARSGKRGKPSSGSGSQGAA
jgi:Clp amino terminal domain, pathogenicity island component